eukprot:985847_1
MPVLRCKIPLLGECHVGKTAVVNVFCDGKDHYPKKYSMTLGGNIQVKSIDIPETDFVVELFILDFSGNEIYEDMRPALCSDVSMLILAYDVTSRRSFEKCQKLLAEIQKKSKNDEKLHGVILACKNDLDEYAEVDFTEAQDFAAQNEFAAFSCSALDCRDVDIPFNFIASQFFERFKAEENTIKEII